MSTKSGEAKTAKKTGEKKKAAPTRVDKALTIPKNFEPRTSKRVQKKVDRFTEVDASKTYKPPTAKKGKGKKLGDMENVASLIEKRKKSDDLLRTIYGLIYGRVTKQSPIKDLLLEFSGVVYDDDDDKGREKLEAKIEKLTVSDLKSVLKFFGQEPDGTKDELVKQLADYLEKPKASDKTFDLGDSKKRKRSASPAKTKKTKKAKKDPNAPKRPLSAYMLFCQDHRAEATKKNKDARVTEIAKILAEQWKKVGKTEKKKYDEKAAKAKEKYEKEMKAYKKKSGSSSEKSPKKSKKESKDKKEKEKEESGSESD